MPPTPIPSKVNQARALRRASDDYDPELATWTTGREWRYCLFCDRLTDRPDSICSAHDFYGCCGNELVPFDATGHALGCKSARPPYHMEDHQ